MSSVTFSNPEGAVPPYENLFSTLAIVPPNTPVAYISTQWAGDVNGNVVAPNDYRAQSKYIWVNINKILKEMGCSLKDIVLKKVTFVDFNDAIGKEVTEAYTEAFPGEEEFWFKSASQFARTPGFHRDGVVLSVDLILALSPK